MAIITKRQKLRGHYYTHTYSDAGLKIRQDDTGVIYDDAWDLTTAEHEYAETEIPIEPEEGDGDEDQ